MTNCCFKQGCELEIQYVCLCLSSVTYICEFHLESHLKLPNRTHFFDSVLIEPSKANKDAILKFLEKEKAKKEKLKKIIYSPFNQNNKISLSDLNSDLKEISCLIENVSQVSEKYQLNSSNSLHDIDIAETIPSNNPEEYSNFTLFCKLSKLRTQRSEILNRANNDPEIEQDFRKNCLLYENNAVQSPLSQSYQEYISDYQKFTSTYLIDNKNNLYIYNTEIDKEEIKALKISGYLGYYSTLIPLPNGELIFIGLNYPSYYALIIDRNYQIRRQLLGAPMLCFVSIYFNRSVYCFGRHSSRKFDLDQNRWSELALMGEVMHGHCNSVVFNKNILIFGDTNRKNFLYSIDIDSFSEILYSFGGGENIPINAGERLYLIVCRGWIYESEILNEYNWKQIATSIIKIDPDRVYCSYNKGGIYISILYNNSRLYFKFDLNKKALIDIALYSKSVGLKRSGDKIEAIDSYEETFRLDPNHSAIYLKKGYTLYYIGKNLEEIKQLNQKMKNHPEDAKYKHLWNHKGKILHNLGRYLDAIENQIKPDYLDAYNNKGVALQSLGRDFEAIYCFCEVIKLAPKADNFYKYNPYAHNKLKPDYEDAYCNTRTDIIKFGDKGGVEINPDFVVAYVNKGISLFNIDRNLEAIECYNQAISYKNDCDIAYTNKGNALQKKGDNIEAIECYNKAIKLAPDSVDNYYNKGATLSNLGRFLEAIECYNKAINLKPDYSYAYNNKGVTLMNLNQYHESIECFKEAIKLKPNYALAYNNQGEALHSLERDIEAIECYNEAIKLKTDEPKFYRNRANALNKLGRQIEALQDFSKADDLIIIGK